MPTIRGNNGDNRLAGPDDFSISTYMYGYGGNDLLAGGFGGDNYIWGGNGHDTLEGGTGINRLYGEDGNDYIRVFWSNTDSRLFGGAGNDILQAGGGGNHLDGGAGSDHMYGGDGGDVFVVDSMRDRIYETWVPQYDNEPDPADTVRARVSYTLSADSRIEILESINPAGSRAINLTGNAFSQTIRGNAGENILQGMGGNDRLVGGAGADVLSGGPGRDTASYETATTGVTASLANPSRNTGEASGDVYRSMEDLAGSLFNDRLTGNSLANRISGSAGNDLLRGGAGHDTLIGGSGNDRLVGDAGQDMLVGGAGADTFLFNQPFDSGIDRIADFRAGQDRIQLDDAVFGALGVGRLPEEAFAANNSGRALDREDRIILEADTGRLFYDADGSGRGQAIQFAMLDTPHLLSATDFFVI
ncbi:calcium-binding protein [Rhodobacter sp. NSM]|uniref:calcium-binding protein n=1 Tax=Rhodobacter sp. NSM TaxID=3457501 RepID=UPI003FD31BB8